jgi:membrane-bound serine protease (ClpP class)
MLEGYGLAVLLLAIGAVLLIGELLLPTHGLLGVAGVAAALLAILVSARENVWAGLVLTVLLALSTPLIWAAAVKIWPKTFVGRRVMLPPLANTPAESRVQVGQSGVTVSELRPMGTCEFDGERVEAISEHGIVPPGTAVRVVALVNNRPTVRTIA